MDNSIPYVMNVESTPYRDTYVIQDSEVFGEKSLVIPFYHPDNATMSKKAYLEDLVDDFADSIGRALPTYLTQYGVPEHEAHAIVNDTLPALASAVLLVFNPENQTTLPPGKDDKSAYYDVSQEPHQLARRKWNVPPLNQIVTHGAKELGRQVEAGYNKVKEKISEVGRNDAVCSYFAYSALPGYLLESNAVASRKPGPGVPLTHDQMFFLYPVYGSYPQDENLRAHYGISKAPVESYRAITFNRDMYLIDSTSIFGRPWASADDFQSVTRTLVHEVRHTQQYRALGFSKSAFGMKYLYQYCKAGWSYSQIDYEREARLYEGLADQLLMRELGYSFFEYWKERHLYYTLGYPIDRAIVATTGPSSKVGHYELRFQNGGVLQGINYADCSRCFRVLSPTALAYRRVSDACTQQGDPWGYCADFHRWWRDQQPHYECVEALRRRLVNGKCI
ncbi:O-methyltransferase [Purpureocillium lavendulum]|uniref:O-methyltransferase n=1 Tax=Purpureocillium lavendulum TaxID=1247861 RepID=A0AB34FL35_9HYPO|nr:O-methyltransferase [Purpureocillium lavendulum]